MRLIALSLLLVFVPKIYAQDFKAEIGLNDRLMNSYLLCDRSVTASIEAKYDEVDVQKYNEEYEKFSACSKKANKVALNSVLKKKISCKDASKILFKNGLTCQVASDNYLKTEKRFGNNSHLNLIKNCKTFIITICEKYLIEKSL